MLLENQWITKVAGNYLAKMARNTVAHSLHEGKYVNLLVVLERKDDQIFGTYPLGITNAQNVLIIQTIFTVYIHIQYIYFTSVNGFLKF